MVSADQGGSLVLIRLPVGCGESGQPYLFGPPSVVGDSGGLKTIVSIA